jgi:hypothetical protein
MREVRTELHNDMVTTGAKLTCKARQGEYVLLHVAGRLRW